MEGLKDDQTNSHAAMAISRLIMGNAPAKCSFLDSFKRLFFGAQLLVIMASLPLLVLVGFRPRKNPYE